ncbi:hypothetical protein ACPUEK_02470 [Marinomonas gallaica]|uniref:hypothetical protein n=1 Tax=Marinomonas gallaica TaxID=1806667 RepID=UPI003CE4A967
MSSPYKAPFPSVLPCLLSISIMFLGVISIAGPFGNLAVYMSHELFTPYFLLCMVFGCICTVSVLVSLMGVIQAKNVLLCYFCITIIYSSIAHFYFFNELTTSNFHGYLTALFFQILGVFAVISKTHVDFIKYRKKHVEYVRSKINS